MEETLKFILLIWFAFPTGTSESYVGKQVITFESLLQEMADKECASRWPDPEYSSLQASSYNRASVAPDKPGWFADSDGVSWIREETNNGRKEYVIMEHNGPGCITRIWTPFFYYSFNNRKGPNIRIYLDGEKEPVVNENFIALLTGKGTIRPPFTGYTARAGVCFLPIPFSESCRITLDDKAFYNIINYRAYPEGTEVKTFSPEQYDEAASKVKSTGEMLLNRMPARKGWQETRKQSIMPKDSLVINLPEGNHAISEMIIHLDVTRNLQSLRSTVLKLTFDANQTVWCPVGDFFCCPDTINQFSTRNLNVSDDGSMTSTWIMPYSSSAQICLLNLQDREVQVSAELNVEDYNWDERSMYFHANWAPFGLLPGNQFFDMNFIDITGKGVLTGDALTVLSPGKGWWGEGDEKIYIDEADIKRNFPSHFGTGTEDYYGWAGGVVPTGKDIFSGPFGSNVRNGNTADPRGYNICVRNRLLDNIPFKNRLVFDMEASPGTDIRKYWNLLSYSAVTYWYGLPGAESNHGPKPEIASEKIMMLDEIDRMQRLVKDSIIIFSAEKLKKLVGDHTE